MEPINIFWFRRDLRLEDNAGLYHALKSGRVLPIFIFDNNILDKLEDKHDKRVVFIHQSLQHIHKQLRAIGSGLQVFLGTPEKVYQQIVATYKVKAVYTNHDYEPYATQRDSGIGQFLHQHGIAFHTFKDQVIFEKDEVLKDDGKPYTVFTPYSKKWKAALSPFYLKAYPTEKYFDKFLQYEPEAMPTIEEIGFNPTAVNIPSAELDLAVVKKYKEQRDYPAINGTSRLSVHLRFGTVSIRKIASVALANNETFLNELIWRDFYHMILWHFPQVAQGKAFKPEYDLIDWRHDEADFEKWCKGMTGYPIVDAGMRELHATGYMHNRVRMIVASFLSKHLLLDWRWGEAYFAQKLLDFDLAANNGGWQWASGSGCDAAPYFRIFNPYLQTQKFDGELAYIKKWVPEFQEFSYPKPMVDHEFARERCLKAYSEVLKKESKMIR